MKVSEVIERLEDYIVSLKQTCKEDPEVRYYNLTIGVDTTTIHGLGWGANEWVQTNNNTDHAKRFNLKRIITDKEENQKKIMKLTNDEISIYQKELERVVSTQECPTE